MTEIKESELDEIFQVASNNGFWGTESQIRLGEIKEKIINDQKLANEYKLYRRTEHQEFIDFCKRIGVAEAERFMPKLLELESKLAEYDDLESKVIPLSEGSAMLQMHLEQLQSQHANLVKAIQDRIKELTEYIADQRARNLHTGSSTVFAEAKLQELQNLLESTKEKK